MSECKTVLRFFTIADYEEEEQWLHQQHRSSLEALSENRVLSS